MTVQPIVSVHLQVLLLTNQNNVTWQFFRCLPGVPRVTEEEKEFGKFDIFDDENEPYSSFKFDYTHRVYERLYRLMKFNTLLNIDVIKEKMIACVQARRNNPSLWVQSLLVAEVKYKVATGYAMQIYHRLSIKRAMLCKFKCSTIFRYQAKYIHQSDGFYSFSAMHD